MDCYYTGVNTQARTVDQQLARIRRGAADIIVDTELRAKLERSLKSATPLKVKLGLSIIGISSIHLLKTFINAANYDTKVLMWQTIIHVAFLASAIAIAYTDRLLHVSHEKH